MQRKPPEGRGNNILKSAWKNSVRQLPRRQLPAVDVTRAALSLPHVLTQESRTEAGELLGTHPTVHTPAPLLNTVLSSTNHKFTFGCCWQGHKSVTRAHVILENWVAAGPYPSGCRGAPEPFSQEHLCPRPLLPFQVVAPHWQSCWLKLALTSEDSKANQNNPTLLNPIDVLMTGVPITWKASLAGNCFDHCCS